MNRNKGINDSRPSQSVHRVIRLVAVTLLIALALFEIGARVIPWTPLQPDEMVYAREDLQIGNNTWLPTTIDLRANQGVRAQRTIEEWYSALNRIPTTWESPLVNCNGMQFTTLNIAFRWHGVTIQAWSGDSCGELAVSSGGILNLFGAHKFDVNAPPPTTP